MRSTRRVLRELERNEVMNRGEPPINLVPMIDILTVLVLYLLVGTIYKHLAVLQLNLPGPMQSVPTDQPLPLQLTVTLRKERLELSNSKGTIGLVPNVNGAYDLATLASRLAEIKRTVPDEDSVTLLLEPDVSYDRLVQVMDATRVFPAGSQEAKVGMAMFPVAAIGDAPRLAEPGSAPAAAAPAPAGKQP